MPLRTQTADLLKGIAALLMIQVHIIELFATNAISESYIGKILMFLGGPPVAPLFILFMGYFIAQSNKTTIQLIIRGLKIIILGFFLNIALNLNLIISVNKGLYNIDIWPYILGVDILPLAGMSIICIALLKKILDKNIILIVALTLTTAYLGGFLLNYIPDEQKSQYLLSFIYGAAWWSYFPLFPWLAYALAGVLFYKIRNKYNFGVLKQLKIKFLAGIILLAFLTFTISYAVTISSDLQVYYYHGTIFFLWTMIFLSGYAYFANEMESKLGNSILFRYLKWLGTNITAIYIIQWILIGNTATAIFKTVSNPFYLILSFIGVLAISSILCYLGINISNKYLNKEIQIKKNAG
ncbi:MAG: acyltransferase family protein [Bacteroidota bacterium]